MRINTNVSALNSQRILGQTGASVAKNIQKLSSGFRINKAADDAAGLGIANKVRADLRSLKQASRNAEQANSLLQVAEGATSTVGGILDRMKELATQAASDNTDQNGRVAIQAEFSQLRDEVTRIVNTTKFQGKSLIGGSFGNAVNTSDAVSTVLEAADGIYGATLNGAAAGTYNVTMNTGAANQIRMTQAATSTTQTLTLAADGKQSINFDKFGITLQADADFARDADGAGATIAQGDLVVTQGADGGAFMVSSSGAYTNHDRVALGSLDLSIIAHGSGASTGLQLGGLDLSLAVDNAAGAQTALAKIDEAVTRVNTVLGQIGAAQNRIEYATSNVKTTIENFHAAESTIRDADMAAEMTEFSKNQILQQAGVSMLAQANSASQQILKLLG